jgi:hypothetical protein
MHRVRTQKRGDTWECSLVSIIICSWISVGINVWRYHDCSRIGKLFEETNGYVYINLQLSTYINDCLIFLYGFCCFFGTIKLIHLCRFNQCIYLFILTVKQAGKELISFGMMFSIVFCFISLFILFIISIKTLVLFECFSNNRNVISNDSIAI